MLSADLILILSLSFGALGVYLFTSVVFRTQSEANSLNWASDDEPVKSKSAFLNFSRPLVHNLTLQQVRRIKAPNYRNKLEQKIKFSGLSEEINVDEFIGLQILWGVLFPILLVILNFGLQLGYPYLLCVGLGVLGFYFPHLHCNQAKKMRNQQALIDLPFFIELLALSTEAGMDFVNAIQKITEKSGDSPLGNELKTVLQDIKLGSSRAEALRGLSQRLDLAEVVSFCSMIIDADQTGVGIGSVLKEQSAQMRLNRMLLAEKKGGEASQLMFIPMMFFIVPAIFIAIIGPVILAQFGG